MEKEMNEFSQPMNDSGKPGTGNQETHIPNKDQASQKLHNRMLVIQAVNYKKQGYTNIKVNHGGEASPPSVHGYTPDLSAEYDSQTTICEIETHDSIQDLRTVDKWRAFDHSGCQFHLVIPNDDFELVKDIVKSNGITVDKFWHIKDY